MNLRSIKSIAPRTYLDDRKESRPLSIPIIQATTFQAESSTQHGIDFKNDIENAEAGLVFPSGMAAITTSLLTILKTGDHVVSQREVFAQTYTFFEKHCPKLGIKVDFADAKEKSDIEAAIKTNTSLIYIESPSNPLLDVVDIEAIASIGKEKNIPVFIDSTFASPYCQNPLHIGVSLVIHSGTKFLGGHSDIMCGAVAGSKEWINQIKEMQILLGTIMDPHAAWLLLRGIKTLALRMEAITSNALQIATFLEKQSGIKSVNYPFLPSSKYYALAKKQMRAGGGVVTFEVKDELPGARRFLDALQLIPIATSLGGVETVIEIPYELDFNEAELGNEVVANRGVKPGMIRLSVGIEDKEDLIEDLKKGCQKF